MLCSQKSCFRSNDHSPGTYLRQSLSPYLLSDSDNYKQFRTQCNLPKKADYLTQMKFRQSPRLQLRLTPQQLLLWPKSFASIFSSYFLQSFNPFSLICYKISIILYYHKYNIHLSHISRSFFHFLQFFNDIKVSNQETPERPFCYENIH